MFKKQTKELNTIIVGLGKVGTTLVENLSKEDNIITVIDKDRDKVFEISNLFDVMGITGTGVNLSTLKEANIASADIFIAVTDSDELNLLCCTIAKAANPNISTVARVRTPAYSHDQGFMIEKLGLDMIINPDSESATEAARILCLPKALDVVTFGKGQIELIKYKLDEKNNLVGKSIYDFGRTRQETVNVCAIERNDNIIIPRGEVVFQAGDVVTFVTSRKMASSFLARIGSKNNKVRDCMIIGGSKCSYYLAKQLDGYGINVKIIERDKACCEQLSELLPKALIINGDGTNEDLLKEEGIEQTEAFVPLTGIDEENVMLSLYAKKVSNAKLITKIDRNTFNSVINQLDLGSVLYPRTITTEAIIAFARAKKASKGSNLESLYHLYDNRAEAIEFSVSDRPEVCNVPIRDLELRDNVVICYLRRKGKLIIPDGDNCIKAGDDVMIVTTESGFNDVTDILK